MTTGPDPWVSGLIHYQHPTRLSSLTKLPGAACYSGLTHRESLTSATERVTCKSCRLTLVFRGARAAP